MIYQANNMDVVLDAIFEAYGTLERAIGIAPNETDDTEPLFLYMNQICFAGITILEKDDESGMIEITQYFASYDGMVSDELTIFRYPFPEGYTDDQRTAYDTYMKETYAKIEELSFADITYTMEEEYYQVEFLLRGLNANENYYAAAQAGYYVSEPESEESKISYEKTVQGLLDNGYIAKYIEEVTE